MQSPVFFNSINVVLPRNNIYKRLGYRMQDASINRNQKRQLEMFIDEAGSLLFIKGAALVIDIKHRTRGEIVFISGDSLSSRHLAYFLRDCKRALLMAATVGCRIMREIEKLSQEDNLAKAVVFDAVASETVDKALDWIMSYFNQTLRRENSALTPRRFSAGYGDLSLSSQKVFYSMLNLKGLGVKITKEFILVPEKSVTAVAGIRG